MTPPTVGLDTLTRAERRALRTLLVRATAAADRPRTGDKLAQLARDAPVRSLPAAAAVHRVSGSVLRGLEGVDGVPETVRAELAAVGERSALHHLVVVGALSQIGGAFDEEQLSWAAMKGPVVAALLYPAVGDRTYADLDLLVHRRDFPKAMRILEDLGYQHSIHNWALAEEMLAGQVGMRSPMLHVDLHWHLHYSRADRRPYAIDPESMLERGRRVVVSGVSTRTLDAVDTLLTLGFHAARSGGHLLVWLKDVERSVAVDDPDLDELVRRCGRYGCGAPVGLILARARALLGAEIPPRVVHALVPRSLRAADRAASALSDPVQLNENRTLSRQLTRSVRSSFLSSVGDVPVRAARWIRRSLSPPPPNETDNQDEKASYLRAVSTSTH